MTLVHLHRSDSDLRRSRFSIIADLRSRLAREEFDVLFAHSIFPAMYARFSTPRPVCIVLHSAGDDYTHWKFRIIERLLATRTSGVVGVSAAQLARFMRRFPRHPRPTVIPNGVSNSLPTKQEYRDAPQDIFTVGRFATQKNPELWSKICAGLKGRFCFSWIGPLPEEGSLQVVATRSMEDGAKLLGPSNDVGYDLMAADLLLHTSHREAHSVVLLEAAAVGVPIVCPSNIAPEIAGVCLAAATFEADSSSSAIHAIQSVGESYGEAVAHARVVQNLVRETHSLSVTFRSYCTLAADIVGSEIEGSGVDE
ncbi:glycosyltransferase [Pseudonocardia endophytica]